MVNVPLVCRRVPRYVHDLYCSLCFRLHFVWKYNNFRSYYFVFCTMNLKRKKKLDAWQQRYICVCTIESIQSQIFFSLTLPDQFKISFIIVLMYIASTDEVFNFFFMKRIFLLVFFSRSKHEHNHIIYFEWFIFAIALIFLKFVFFFLWMNCFLFR